MEKEKVMKERYSSEEGLFNPIRIEDLVCNTCIFVYDNPRLVTKCEQYVDAKPGKVLYGKDCDKYKDAKGK